MKISYAITVCNELEEIQRLIPLLYEIKRQEDEIVVLLDKPKVSQELIDQLYRYSSANWIFLRESEFKGHFADWKNELNSLCSGDYIFQIDADEYPNVNLIENLPFILENNEADIILVPRVNTVQGLTPEHITKWGWNVSDKGWINFPDYQTRIYKNIPEIRWEGKVHERITGTKTFSPLPAEEVWSLYHPKEITRQEKQNNFYDTL